MHSPIRHGELLLLPVRSAPAGATEQVTSCVVGRSASGLQHVLDSDRAFARIVATDGDLYVDLDAPTRLLHGADNKQHPELEVPAGTWRVLGRTASAG
jgi:hypothetical protein